MSRWFRHYAGMMRDEKLVRAAVKSRQSIERVVWVWGAILESASELDEGGRHDLDPAFAAYFLRTDEASLISVFDGLHSEGLLTGNSVADWHKFSRHSARLPWSEWAVIRLGVFQRDDFKCRYCGASGVPLQCDHVVPVSRGGSNDPLNLVTACGPCNQAKGDKSLAEMGWTL